jgi:hypothetical protein
MKLFEFILLYDIHDLVTMIKYMYFTNIIFVNTHKSLFNFAKNQFYTTNKMSNVNFKVNNICKYTS